MLAVITRLFLPYLIVVFHGIPPVEVNVGVAFETVSFSRLYCVDYIQPERARHCFFENRNR